MQTTMDEAIRSDPELAAAVERATQLVLEELGKASDRATIEWGLERDEQNQPLLRLTLNDREGEVSQTTEFSPAELANELRFIKRANRLWDSVRQADIRRRLARVKEALLALEED